MTHKDYCLDWLEWFKEWVEKHDAAHSNAILATTKKTFDYHIWQSGDELHFTSGIRFKINDSDREVFIPYVNRNYTITDKGDSYFFKDVLDSLMRVIVYGKEDFNLAYIFSGKSDLNWKERMSNKEGHVNRTLRDIINEVHPGTIRE